MSIIFEPNNKIFTMQTKHTTWQAKVSKYGHLLHVYYGSKVEDADLSYLIRGINRGFSGTPYIACDDRGYSLDTYPQEYSSWGSGDYRSSCLEIEHEDGSRAAELLYVSHKIYDGKYILPGLPAIWGKPSEIETLEVLMKDRSTEIEVILYYSVLEEYDVITRACKICNTGNKPVFLHKALSACLDLQRNDLDMVSFHGRHAMERILQRNHAQHGKMSVGSVRGTSSHQANPFVILCDQTAGEEHGECYGMSFVYSGNFIAETEVDQINQTRFTMGIHPDGFRYLLEAKEAFVAPEVIFSYSSKGFGTLSQNFHDLYRNHLIRSTFKNKRRPILINNWEATEFDFTEKELVSLAVSAKELGIELFVMDDGWFGSRNHDKSGLGDWFANREKLPSGVKGFAEKIHKLGMMFGIWIEPEMVNEDSELYRKHPQWCLKIPGRLPNLERCQMVLDMTRKDVRDYLFEAVSKVLDESHAEYVKWDMNRNLSDVWSADLPGERQGEVYHRYVLGVYELIERFTSKYPDILWEGCSGGGGRFDAGILYYMPQSWCSDNTDAIERITIQYGTSFGYPISCVGAHVSVSPNQQTGRETSIETRAAVAMAGTFGYELDVRKLNEEEREKVKEQIVFFKKYYDLIHEGDYYRLTEVGKRTDLAAWQFVSKDKSESLICTVMLQAKANPPFLRLRVRGLKEESLYHMEGTETFYKGSALMHAGINLPVVYGDYQNVNFVFQEVLS